MKSFIQNISNKALYLTLAMGLVSTLAFAGATTVAAATDCSAGGTPNAPVCQAQKGVDGIGGTTKGNTAADFNNLIKQIINILLFLIGAIAVIMIIIGGIRYTTSGGDSSQAKGARDTILYAVIGLVIAIMAYAIVNFVISRF